MSRPLSTVPSHVSRILAKLGARGRVDHVRWRSRVSLRLRTAARLRTAHR